MKNKRLEKLFNEWWENLAPDQKFGINYKQGAWIAFKQGFEIGKKK